MLTVCDESTLELLAKKLELYEVVVTRFHEPDLDDELTAFAAAGPLAQRKLKGFPLLLGRG